VIGRIVTSLQESEVAVGCDNSKNGPRMCSKLSIQRGIIYVFHQNLPTLPKEKKKKKEKKLQSEFSFKIKNNKEKKARKANEEMSK
jgi:hypothetical protein